MWGNKFGKELWDSLTVATWRDTIQQVKMATRMMMIFNMVIAMLVVMSMIMTIMMANGTQFNQLHKQ